MTEPDFVKLRELAVEAVDARAKMSAFIGAGLPVDYSVARQDHESAITSLRKALTPAVVIALVDDLRDAMMALTTALNAADDAYEEWDKAPEGMKAGKVLRALCVPSLKYRADITAMHETRKRIDALLNASAIKNGEAFSIAQAASATGDVDAS